MRTPIRGGESLTGRVSPPIVVSAALINETGRQREASQRVMSGALADVHSSSESLFVWCLQSACRSPLSWDADTWMQYGSRLMRPRLLFPSVSHG